ncbi:MAG TPA: SAM-dependent methyltransferase [Burkholderiales bacterium]|nr:SAM-dependent methyltransferase [Burkholderiales bacterium]
MVLAPATLSAVHELRRFVAENPKSARRFLKSAGYPLALRNVRIDTLNQHTAESALAALLAPLLEGEDCGLMSEAGCPAVADPGAALVRLAHASGIRVAPLVGPSAILLAVMGCGLNGQHFTFHGYLPVEGVALRRRLRELEDEAARSGAAQIFIETPYRNGAVLRAMLEVCRSSSLLCIATDLTLPTESIATRTIAEWKKKPPDLNRRPTVFVLGRDAILSARSAR